MKSFKRLRHHKALRCVGLGLTLVVALLAAAIVSSVTVDLGPIARQKAEIEGSKYIERPMHIGSLRIRLLTGKFLVENLTIDGLHEGDRPFFTARQLAVSLDWMPAIARRPDITITAVEMTDWHMLVEKWENSHNFPRLNHDDSRLGWEINFLSFACVYVLAALLWLRFDSTKPVVPERERPSRACGLSGPRPRPRKSARSVSHSTGPCVRPSRLRT